MLFESLRRFVPKPHAVYGSPLARHDDQFQTLLDGAPAPKMQLSRIWWLVAFGATVGAALDYLHTHGEEIVYPEGTNHWRGIATFAFVYTAGPITFIKVFGSEYKHHVPAPYSRSLPAMALWCVMYALTAYGDCNSYLTASVLAVVMVYHWRTVDVGTLRALVNAIVGGCLCAAVEAALAGYFGTMSYVTQDIAGVPIWLPMLYASGCTSVVQVARRVLYLEPPLHLGDGPIAISSEWVPAKTLPAEGTVGLDRELHLLNAALSPAIPFC